jgi:exopolysaccharide production protein ExoZ
VFRLRVRSPLGRTVFFLTVAATLAAYYAVYGGHIRLVMFIAGILLYEALPCALLFIMLRWRSAS